MKFRNVVLLFIIALLLAAWFTKPSLGDFKKFTESSNKITAPPMIEVVEGYVYAVYSVSYFDIRKIPGTKSGKGESEIAVPLKKEKYLGLFGKFWKID
jgi:hypothetical protein